MYSKFEQLLQNNKVTAFQVSKATGISSGNLSDWKKGKVKRLSAGNLKKIADYFNVSVDYFFDNDEDIPELINGDKELTEYLEDLRNRPEMRMLFSITSTCTKEEVEQAVRIIEALRNGK